MNLSNHSNLYRLSAQALRQRFEKGDISAETIASYALQRADKMGSELGAFLHLLSDRVLEQARALDKKRAAGKPVGKLAGIPIAIKDLINIKGERTTCGSRFLSNFRSPFDASVIRFLEDEDALLIGKTNMDEFAMGSSGEHSGFFPAKNPWALDHSPGGSSSGSAVAVAARICPLALGSDTGGSIRQPAAMCGIVGFKPTYGRVSRYGLVAFASSLDQIGPFATSVKDAALCMEVIGRHCPKDATSLPAPQISYTQHIETPIEKTVIGIPWKFLKGLSSEINENFLKSVETFKAMGAECIEVDLDILNYAIAAYYILAPAEASTNLARFDGIRYGVRSGRATTVEEIYRFSRQEGFGDEVKNRILLGTYVLSAGFQDAYYRKAQKVRTLIVEKLTQAFAHCSLIALPTTPTTAFPLGAIHDPLDEYLQDLYTVGINLAGVPGLSILSGFDQAKRPIGLQIIGPKMSDGDVLRFGHHFENRCGLNHSIPPLFDKEA